MLQKYMSIYCFYAAVLFFCLLWSDNIYARELIEIPKNWPWIGVTVNNLSSAPSDIAKLKNILPRMNSVRLTLKPRLLSQRDKLSAEAAWLESLAWADTMLDACRDAGIVGIISLNQFPIDPAFNLTERSAEFWNNKKHRDKVILSVNKMVKHFLTRGDELAAIEVLSEPVEQNGKVVKLPEQWPVLLERIVSEIRKLSDIWVVVTPVLGGLPHGYMSSYPLSYGRLVYGAHVYIPHSYTHQMIGGRESTYSYPGIIDAVRWDYDRLRKRLSGLKIFQEKHGVPVWVGEFGVVRWAFGSERYLKDLVSIFNEYHLGWAYFNIGGFHGWNPNYNSEFPGIRPHASAREKQKIGIVSQRWNTLRSVFQNSLGTE